MSRAFLSRLLPGQAALQKASSTAKKAEPRSDERDEQQGPRRSKKARNVVDEILARTSCRFALPDASDVFVRDGLALFVVERIVAGQKVQVVGDFVIDCFVDLVTDIEGRF